MVSLENVEKNSFYIMKSSLVNEILKV